MGLPAHWWRDRVRCCSGRIEDFVGDLLIVPGPAAGEWLLTADRETEQEEALARGVRVLRCVQPPPGGDDPIAYPAICAEDWYQVALDGAAGENAATVLLPPLCHPEGDAGVAEGAISSIRRGLARHPSIRQLLIVCAEEATARRWRAALFTAGRPHPCPNIATELMRVACADGNGLVLPEECYRGCTPGRFNSDEGVVHYQFGEEDGRLRLEVCEIVGPDRIGRHLLVEADGRSTELPPVCGRRLVRSPVTARITASPTRCKQASRTSAGRAGSDTGQAGSRSSRLAVRAQPGADSVPERHPPEGSAIDSEAGTPSIRALSGYRATIRRLPEGSGATGRAAIVRSGQARSNGRWNCSIDHPR